MKHRSSLSFIGVCFTLLALGLLLSCSPSNEQTLNAAATSTPTVQHEVVPVGTFTAHEPSATAPADYTKQEGIPIYPGARLMKGGPKPGSGDAALGGVPYSGRYEFTSTDDASAVATFYKTTLANTGWQLTKESNLKSGSIGLHYQQLNAKGGVPTRRILDLGIDYDAECLCTDILVDFERWPSAAHVPVYPGASELESHYEDIPVPQSEYKLSYKVTTYVTAANVLQVNAYYREAMVEEGWQLQGENIFAPGVNYSYGHGMTPGVSTGSLISVEVVSVSGEQTHIRISAGGEGLQIPGSH